jgi:hypothetical protein
MVNIPIKISILLVPALICLSCKKEQSPILTQASLNIVNTIVGGDAVKMGSNRVSVANNNYAHFGLITNDADIYIYPINDSINPYFHSNKSLDIETGGIYTLFLCGIAPAAEAIWVKEEIPYYADSSVGVRFINLSPNSKAVNITLSTSPSSNEFSNIAYKQITDFKKYPALASNTKCNFQVRNVGTNTIIASYDLLIPRFKNVTLVLRGLVGASPSAGITLVNHF